jgi:hypothetical protein
MVVNSLLCSQIEKKVGDAKHLMAFFVYCFKCKDAVILEPAVRIQNVYLCMLKVLQQFLIYFGIGTVKRLEAVTNTACEFGTAKLLTFCRQG